MLIKLFIILLFQSFVESQTIDSGKLIIVNTTAGPVQGIQKVSVLKRNYFSFQGIPYMKSPLGKNRFRDPQAPDKWTTPFNATEEPPSYPCFNAIEVFVGQEDAAVINVYTPYITPSKLLPVLVYIHGGSFNSGSSKTDILGPDFLLQKDVVLVTFNYRYGAFGFLSLKDANLGIPGNVGLKDQSFAMKWVQRNIQNFGGDKRQVLLFGESAGAASVHLHMLSNQSKGLFKRAIALSGSAMSPWAIPPITDFAERLALRMGFNGTTENQMLEFFESKNAFELVSAQAFVTNDEEKYGKLIDISIGPVVEPAWSKNPFLSEAVVFSARKSWSNNIDCIIGATSFEGLFLAKAEKLEKFDLFIKTFNENIAFFAPLDNLKLNSSSAKAKVYGERIKQLYYGNSRNLSRHDLEPFYHFLSDYLFIHGNYRAIQSRLKFGKGRTFMYRFNGDTSLNMAKIYSAQKGLTPGACHTDDLFYIFNTIYTQLPKTTSTEFKLMNTMVDLITSFAIHGTPTLNQEKVWKEVARKEKEPTLLNIANDGCSMIALPEYGKIKVFNEIYEEENVDLY